MPLTGVHHPLISQLSIACICCRCSPEISSWAKPDDKADSSVARIAFSLTLLIETPHENHLTFSSTTGGCPDPVRKREPRQQTACHQSLTLTPDGQPQCQPAPDSRAATAGSLHTAQLSLMCTDSAPGKQNSERPTLGRLPTRQVTS